MSIPRFELPAESEEWPDVIDVDGQQYISPASIGWESAFTVTEESAMATLEAKQYRQQIQRYEPLLVFSKKPIPFPAHGPETAYKYSIYLREKTAEDD
jgi:hypothetical protein